MDSNKKEQKVQGAWLKLFCPNARCLTEEEILALPPEKVGEAEKSGVKGLWLEIFCPDESCLAEDERIQMPVKKGSHHKEEGYWLNLFCPDKRCIIDEDTSLP